MLSLKSLVSASLIAVALPVSASASSAFEPAFPLFAALLSRHAPPLILADYVFRPSPGPVLRQVPSFPLFRASFNCVVRGTPVEFPDDLHIWSSFAVASGTVVHWSVPGTNMSGSVVLPALAAGQHHFVSHALTNPPAMPR